MKGTNILKSGSKTKYKHLPATIIIFITQDDIFKKDLAKYTFKEKCEEVERLIELDEIVTQVKQSEEWEGTEMNILDIGIAKGREEGREEGIQEGIHAMIRACKNMNVTREQVLEQLQEQFLVTKDKAQEYIEAYW